MLERIRASPMPIYKIAKYGFEIIEWRNMAPIVTMTKISR